MNEYKTGNEQKELLEETLGKLPSVVREYIPDTNLEYYKRP
ncbi:MAG: hypothetical protein UW30_C0001G0058 [Candidatus Giovannonibacteria bacterium GW2011_GWA2_44_13b]|uniref:Uncharacterized protein n=1 Tax=Candidatus Giovannonibacteria bacterium GW2011_GWA2_44_13b TaxID=1618647 RepID=A0A0G1H748_9BACT|nr:MAG: hypothetical protein UW30_C0001G0058 [Candidatus Giovannonibacteria bacterium GW2011_GWA2_44_13b]